MSLPRMRTAPQCIAELKKIDPDTAFTLRALRRMINTGEIPVVNVQSKKLINFDVLLEYLEKGNNQVQNDYGTIRRIG